MAKRYVFVAKSSYPYYEVVDVEFEYYKGFAVSQKQKSIRALHESYKKIYPWSSVLEISTKGLDAIGVALSAFNLQIPYENRMISVECAFQGSKKFEKGGPYFDLYDVSSWEAKKDLRLKESGAIEEFVFNGENFENEPKDYFYNWIYIKALYGNTKYLKYLEKYSAFTDIEFNPKKSVNCQAKACAIAKGLLSAGLLVQCMADKEQFREEVYGNINAAYKQMSLVDLMITDMEDTKNADANEYSLLSS